MKARSEETDEWSILKNPMLSLRNFSVARQGKFKNWM
jgi:hypothetical protein